MQLFGHELNRLAKTLLLLVPLFLLASGTYGFMAYLANHTNVPRDKGFAVILLGLAALASAGILGIAIVVVLIVWGVRAAVLRARPREQP